MRNLNRIRKGKSSKAAKRSEEILGLMAHAAGSVILRDILTDTGRLLKIERKVGA